MQCSEAFELLCGHLDHENTPQEEAALQAHLQSCAGCRALLRQLEENDAALAHLHREAPPQLLTGVMERLKNPEPEKKRKKWHFHFTAIAAAAALVLLIGTGAISIFDQGTKYAGEEYAAADAADPAEAGQGEAEFSVESSDTTKEQKSDSLQLGAYTPPNADVAASEEKADYQAMADREGCDILVLHDGSAAQLPQLQNPEKMEDGSMRCTLAAEELGSVLDSLDPDTYEYFPCSTGQENPVIVLFPAGGA